MDARTQWLLAGPGWVEYRTRRDLLDEPEENTAVRAARQAALTDPQVRGLVDELGQWPGSILSNHKDAGHCLHRLTFAAELGLPMGDPGMGRLVGQLMEHQSAQGPFQVLMNIPKHFGGSGEDVWAWALCDAPLLIHALIRLGMGQDPRVRTAIEYLVARLRPNGWGCTVSPELGKFRGPGRKEDPCPYATLVMLQVLAELPELRDHEAAKAGAEALLALWSARRERHPYMFYMGTDFCKLKAPLLWYDILHVTDVLSRFPWLRQDARLREMVDICVAKADADGRYSPESTWKAWGEWEFGQKRAPSRWLTLVVLRMARRLGA